jgi:hypothetical protein
MYKTKTSIDRNYLYVSFDGMLKMEEGQAAVREVIENAKNLRPGFAIINDLTKARPTTPDVTEELKRAQATLFKMGAKKAIRIVPKSAVVAKLQFQRVQQDAKAAYETVDVESLEDAIRALG